MRRRVRSSSWLIFVMVCLVATASSQSVPPVSFRGAPTYGAGSGLLYSVAVGDFNGDGRPDLAVTSEGPSFNIGNVSVLLGNGDGTFQAAVNYTVGDSPRSVRWGTSMGTANPIWRWRTCTATTSTCSWAMATAPSRRQ